MLFQNSIFFYWVCEQCDLTFEIYSIASWISLSWHASLLHSSLSTAHRMLKNMILIITDTNYKFFKS